MKRLNILTTIGIIAGIFVSVMFFYLGIQARTGGTVPQIFQKTYVVEGKYYGEPRDVRVWITPNEEAIKREALKLKQDNDIATISAVYNFLEQKYNYTLDNIVVTDSGIIILKAYPDQWNMPIESLAIIHQNDGNFYGDCEDGTYLLIAILRYLGINAYANLGTVELPSGIYGHGYGTVIINGKEYLLETTLGQSLAELKPVPSFYHPTLKFNEKDVIPITGEDINKVVHIYPPLPPACLNELKKALGE